MKKIYGKVLKKAKKDWGLKGRTTNEEKAFIEGATFVANELLKEARQLLENLRKQKNI